MPPPAARTIGMVAAATVVIATLAGCTTSANGTPTPDTQSSAPETSATERTSSSSPSSEDETYGAPRVAEPLDADPFLADPCATLTPVQQADLGISRTGEPRPDGPNGPTCIWHSDADSGAISVTFLIENQNGLSDTYRGRDQFELFEETTVTGHPAVISGLTDERPYGICGVVVGVSDTLTFHALEQGELDPEGACNRAKQAAAAVIATLQKGGS